MLISGRNRATEYYCQELGLKVGLLVVGSKVTSSVHGMRWYGDRRQQTSLPEIVCGKALAEGHCSVVEWIM